MLKQIFAGVAETAAKKCKILEISVFSMGSSGTYSSHVATHHQANVLGEGMDQME